MGEESETILEQIQFEGLIKGLVDNEYGCCDDFISSDMASGLNANIQALIVAGKMAPAGIGNRDKLHLDGLIRKDEINWIDELSLEQSEAYYIKKVGSFIKYLNSTCYTSIKSFESHYANYAKESFYKRHIDQFKGETARKFSIILYLNENWQLADGGLLSLYPNSVEQIDITPLAGRLVFFRSDKMEHEVHPSFTRERRSIAGWFKN